MIKIFSKARPSRGYIEFIHLFLMGFLVTVILVMVRLHFIQLALSMVVLSKWRMFVVRPRFWLANIRANAVDIMFGLSIVLFITNSNGIYEQVIWALIYGIWLIFIKPASSLLMTSLQAFIGQLTALSALYLVWASGPLYGLTILTGLICYLSARHFFDGYNETYAKLLAYTWSYFAAALTWLLGHWLIYYYSVIAQITLFLSVIGYGLGGLYYLDHNDRLNKRIKNQLLVILIAIVFIIIIFSDWGNKIV